MQHEERGAGQVGFTDKDFKVCGLCGALNWLDSGSCFVCGWRGVFHFDADTVQEAMLEFEERYGSLSERALTEEILPDAPPSERGFFSSLIYKLKRFLSGNPHE